MKIIINLFLVFSAYLFAIILAIALLSLWLRPRKENPEE